MKVKNSEPAADVRKFNGIGIKHRNNKLIAFIKDGKTIEVKNGNILAAWKKLL